jgi:hypothetical protein
MDASTNVDRPAERHSYPGGPTSFTINSGILVHMFLIGLPLAFINAKLSNSPVLAHGHDQSA